MKQQDDENKQSKIYKYLKLAKDIVELFWADPLFPAKLFLDKIEDKYGQLDVIFCLIFAIGGILAMKLIDESIHPSLIAIFIVLLACITIASFVFLILIKKLEIKK